MHTDSKQAPKIEQSQPASDKNETPELQQRRTDGRKGLLWTVECYYRKGPEVLRLAIRNLYWYEIREFQARVWTDGIIRWVDPGHACIISPFDIETVDLTKQSAYFSDLYDK